MTREELGDERYVNLATFRKTGREVLTPVWIAPEGERLCVYTNVTSGKVKRIRNGGRVRLAPCDARGRLRRMLDDPEAVERGLAAIERKYGWQMRLALFASRLSGRYAQRGVIEISVPPPEAPTSP